MLLSCNRINKTFLDKTVLSNITFSIDEHEKIAIVGDNGCGKSTLLKIIVGQLSKDAGSIALSKNTTIGYLAQHQNIDSNNTLYNELISAREDIIELEAKISDIQSKMDIVSDNELEQLIKTYSSLNTQYEYIGGYSYKSEVQGILNGLGFINEDYNKKLSEFSGGQKTRIALGKMLLSSPNLLILDEPTNHLDIESINWLENYLVSFKGAVILVSHDRYFLNKIVNKIIHIESGISTTYIGNYSDFTKKYNQQREIALKHYENQQQEIKHQQAVIDKLRSFNREKSIKRAESRQKSLDKIEIIEKPKELQNKMRLCFNLQIASGNDVLTVDNLTKSFKNKHLFTNISFDIKKGEKVALIGANGVGKTTILKIINRFLDADSGSFRLGSNVNIAYYDQEQQLLDSSKTLLDEISDLRPELTNTEIRNILAAYLFTQDDVFKTISSLSGGEKGRLSLAKLMLSKANFLILDEPTNHLDIISKDILERAINEYEGTILYVSHDRYFINNTATRILSMSNNQMYNYLGNYDYYLEKKTVVENPAITVKHDSSVNTKNIVNSVSSTPVESFSKSNWKASKEAQSKERKRQNALKNIENRIDKLEARISEIETDMLKPDVSSDISKLLPLSNEKEVLDAELLKLMEEWEELA